MVGAAQHGGVLKHAGCGFQCEAGKRAADVGQQLRAVKPGGRIQAGRVSSALATPVKAGVAAVISQVGTAAR